MKTFAKGKIITILSLTLTLSVVAACGMLANTYAKYTGETTGSGTMTVAKWNFEKDNPEKTFTINFDGTVDEDTLATGKIAPGTKGKFDVDLCNTQTDTGVDYTITLDQIIGMPQNLKFYTAESRGDNVELKPNDVNSKITGKLTPHQTSHKVTIYWEWKYSTGTEDDTKDTTDGKNATGTPFSVGVTIKGVQTTPVFS